LHEVGDDQDIREGGAIMKVDELSVARPIHGALHLRQLKSKDERNKKQNKSDMNVERFFSNVRGSLSLRRQRRI